MSTTAGPSSQSQSKAGFTETLEKIDRALADAADPGEHSERTSRPKESPLSTALAGLVETLNLLVIFGFTFACVYLWSESKPVPTTVTSSGTVATSVIIEWADARGIVTASAGGAVALSPTQLEQLLASARPHRLIAIDQPDGKHVLVPMGNVRTVHLEPAVPGMALSTIRVIDQPTEQTLPVEQGVPAGK